MGCLYLYFLTLSVPDTSLIHPSGSGPSAGRVGSGHVVLNLKNTYSVSRCWRIYWLDCSTVCCSDYGHQCQPFTQFTTSCYKYLVFYTEALISLPNRQFTREFLLCCWCRCQRRRVVNLTDFKYCQGTPNNGHLSLSDCIFLCQIAISCKSRTVRQRHSHIRR